MVFYRHIELLLFYLRSIVKFFLCGYREVVNQATVHMPIYGGTLFAGECLRLSDHL
jgi:hypothetical protein